MSRWPEIRELTRVRTLAFMRQKEIVFWVFVFPMVLAAVLGFAFQSGGPTSSVVGVLHAADANELILRLDEEALVELKRFDDRDAAFLALRSGKIGREHSTRGESRPSRTAVRGRGVGVVREAAGRQAASRW